MVKRYGVRCATPNILVDLQFRLIQPISGDMMVYYWFTTLGYSGNNSGILTMMIVAGIELDLRNTHADNI